MKWIKEQEAELYRLCFKGKRNSELAVIFNCEIKDIHAARSRLGITIDKVKAAKAALVKDKEAARQETVDRGSKRKKLKPCPFCGGEAAETESLTGGLYFVVCSDNDCAAIGAYRYSEEEAIKAWNRRVREED